MFGSYPLGNRWIVEAVGSQEDPSPEYAIEAWTICAMS